MLTVGWLIGIPARTARTTNRQRADIRGRTPQPRCFARQASRRFMNCSEEKSVRQVGLYCHSNFRSTGCPVQISSSLFSVFVERFSNNRLTGTTISDTATFFQSFTYPLLINADTYPRGGREMLGCTLSHPKLRFKKHRFCRHDYIRYLT